MFISERQYPLPLTTYSVSVCVCVCVENSKVFFKEYHPLTGPLKHLSPKRKHHDRWGFAAARISSAYYYYTAAAVNGRGGGRGR